MSKDRTVRTPGDSPVDTEADAAGDTQDTADEAPAAAKGLPHPSTVDPKKITKAVLTSQGWICPAPKA